MDYEESRDNAPEKPKPKPVKKIAVKVISESDETALVEWGEQRAYIPASVLVDGKVAEDELAAGVSYGEDWAALLGTSATPKAVMAEFHRRGIWTVADLESMYTQARQVFAGLHEKDFAELLRGMRR